MEKRLEMLYELLPKNGRGIVDVGTDHGQIPIRMALADYSGNLFATDIAEGPLNSACRAAKANGLDQRICFLLCDGLELIPPEQVDCILIAGMGGDTVCGILDRAEWLASSQYRLVLQPMTRPEVVRYWLLHNDFLIDTEAAVSEGKHLYQMFRARLGKSEHMTDAEYITGSRNVSRMGEPLGTVVDHQLRTIEKKINGIQRAGTTSSHEYSFYIGILHELQEMKSTLGE